MLLFQERQLDDDGCEYVLFVLDVKNKTNLYSISKQAEDFLSQSENIYQKFVSFCSKFQYD